VTFSARFVAAVLGLALGAAVSARAETVALSVSPNGFQPKVVNVRKGESVRLELTSPEGEHCFALDAWRIEKRIRPGKATVVELVPDRAGTFPFYCCLESGAAAEREHGRLVVTE
jgi:heme/copper-type cytochrome/quinol oxidase subunit 2